MSTEIYLRKSAYEILISRSLPGPEKARHFRSINAYFHFLNLVQSGKSNTAQMQFAKLKTYLSKAIERLRKRMKDRPVKQLLTSLAISLELAISLWQIDDIIQQALEITRPLLNND